MTVKEFFKNDHIQLALATGASVIILAVFFKKIMHIPVPALESSLPGFVFLGFEVLREKRKSFGPPWSRPWPWIVIMFAAVAVVIVRHLLIIE